MYISKFRKNVIMKEDVYLLPRESVPFLLNMSESRPRKSRLLPAALMSESDP